MNTDKKITFCNISFDAITREEALEKVKVFMQEKVQVFAATPNPEMVVESRKNTKFLLTLQSTHFTIADGVGILWATKFLSLWNPKNTLFRLFTAPIQAIWSLFRGAISPQYFRTVLPERVTGTDMFQDIAKEASKKNWNIFLLGAAPGVAEKCKEVLEKRYAGVNIVGTHAGSPAESEEKEILEKIQNSNAHIVFVAFGSPKQEFWIARNLQNMPQVKLAMGIGGAFDFVVGKQKRAPKIMRKLGLEWLCRVFHEPKRIKRIWNATGRFICVVVGEKVKA